MPKYPIDAKDPYVDPDTGVLRNRFGIGDQAELDRVEATFAAVGSYELAVSPVRGEFDLAHLQQIHQRLFGDVYDWASKISSVDISKGTTRFASHEQIASYAPQITRPLSREGLLRGLAPDSFSERAGHYLGELNVLHPFREGNGRSIREFIGQLAKDAGYGIDWQGVERGKMTLASIEAYQGDSQRMASLIRANLQDLEREYALDLAKAVAGDRARVVLAAPGQSYGSDHWIDRAVPGSRAEGARWGDDPTQPSRAAQRGSRRPWADDRDPLSTWWRWLGRGIFATARAREFNAAAAT